MEKKLKKLEKALYPTEIDNTIKDFLSFLYDEQDKYPFEELELCNTDSMFDSNHYADSEFLFYLDKAKTSLFKKNIIVFSSFADYEKNWYAFWKTEASDDISSIPIVAFNSEGDSWVVANNFYDFIKIIFFASSISSENINWADNLDRWLEKYEGTNISWEWLENKGLLTSLEQFNMETITSLPISAKKKYQKNFESWLFSLSSKRPIDDSIVTMDFLSRINNDSEYFFYKYAGCIKLDIDNSNETNAWFSHEYVDFVALYDSRSQNKTIVIEDEYVELQYANIKIPERFGIDYGKKEIFCYVDTLSLIKRYQQLSYLMLGWAEMNYICPTELFETHKERDEAYLKEKEYFISDPYLALYWLVYFGLHFDSRYEEVKELVIEKKLNDKLSYLNEPLEFFENASDISIFREKVLSQVYDAQSYLEKLSYDMWLTYIYKNGGGKESYNQWFYTLLLNPKVDNLLIKKIRWIKNNVEKLSLWERVKIDYSTIENIPFTSYIQACNTSLSKEEKTNFAKEFVADLDNHKDVLASKTSHSFTQIMLYDIKNVISNEFIDSYRNLVEHYFVGEKDSDEYVAILKDVFNEDNS